MAKRAKEEVARQVQTSNGLEQVVHKRSVEDDSPLPSPEELARYKEVDPRIIEFFMEQSRCEQLNRHVMERETLGFLSKYHSQKYRINRIGLLVITLILLFVCVLAGLCFWLGYSGFGATLASFDVLGVIVVIAGIIKSFQQPSVSSLEGQK